MGVIALLIVIAVLAATIFVQIQARQQVDVVSALEYQPAVNVILGYFGPIWTCIPGPGTLNYRPKLRMDAPTISIKVESGPDGRCNVTIWTSNYITRFGAMNHATLMWRKKCGLAKRLSVDVADLKLS